MVSWWLVTLHSVLVWGVVVLSSPLDKVQFQNVTWYLQNVFENNKSVKFPDDTLRSSEELSYSDENYVTLMIQPKTRQGIRLAHLEEFECTMTVKNIWSFTLTFNSVTKLWLVSALKHLNDASISTANDFEYKIKRFLILTRKINWKAETETLVFEDALGKRSLEWKRRVSEDAILLSKLVDRMMFSLRLNMSGYPLRIELDSSQIFQEYLLDSLANVDAIWNLIEKVDEDQVLSVINDEEFQTVNVPPSVVESIHNQTWGVTSEDN